MNEAAKLIKEVGIYRLCGTDGCLCMHCAVRGVSVDISCRKSSSGSEKIKPHFYGITLRVHSERLDASGEALKEVADEVCSQIRDKGYAIAVRYCDYRYDREQICISCHKDRVNAAGYLCEECIVKEQPFGGKVADSYDYRKFEFEVSEAAE